MFVRPLRSLVVLLVSVSLAACWEDVQSTEPSDELIQAADGRLLATPAAPTKTATPGLRQERLSTTGRTFGLYVPTTYRPDTPAPVIIMLHGRGVTGGGEGIALNFQEIAETAGVVLVAPNSRGDTWDLILGEVGFDVAFINGVLRWTFDNINVDPARLTLGGFSDGGTYATWLGLRNGALFAKIAVFSGCSTVPGGRRGTPLMFVTHGVTDSAFPIDDCARTLVPGLRERGYDIRYLEYEAGHIIPFEIADQVFAWIAGS
jgi:phospholipase/carboxylesterase